MEERGRKKTLSPDSFACCYLSWFYGACVNANLVAIVS